MTTTRICNRRIYLYTPLVVFVLFCSTVPLRADAAAGTAGKDWILAASQFVYAGETGSGETEAAARNIPKLILERISAGIQRLSLPDEQTDRKLDELQTGRLSLLLELAKEMKTRDSLILNTTDSSTLRKAVAAQDKIIAGVKKSIADNLAQTDAVRNGAGKNVSGKKNVHPVTETVGLYKDDPAELFDMPDTGTSPDYTSYACGRAAADAKINGLITGVIMLYGDYAAVTATLYLYPGGRSAGSVTEIGQLADPIGISENLARSLLPKITNSMPVVLHVTVDPPEAAGSCTVSVDGSVYSTDLSDIVTDAGIHLLTVDAAGYRRAGIRYAFTGATGFDVHAVLAPEIPGVLHVRFVQPLAGTLYTNGIDGIPVSRSGGLYTDISVNGRPVIAQLTDTAGRSLFFYIPESLAAAGGGVKIAGAPGDVSADIEKHRRNMYTAYSAFILSLPLSFYTYGRFVNSYNANLFGDIDTESARTWQQYCWAAVGVSAVLGAVFSYQLVRYLLSANAVLPEDAERDYE